MAAERVDLSGTGEQHRVTASRRHLYHVAVHRHLRRGASANRKVFPVKWCDSCAAVNLSLTAGVGPGFDHGSRGGLSAWGATSRLTMFAYKKEKYCASVTKNRIVCCA